MTDVTDLIQARMYSENAPLIPLVTEHILKAGGKRLRPMLTLASAKLMGYEGNDHIHLAAVVELIHTATLLHDDVVDKSEKRRGQITANYKWDNKSSVLVGDYLFARAFQLMVDVGSIKILSSLSQASAEISQSEVLQMTIAKNVRSTESDYMEVINGKTAKLFSSACEVGGLISKANITETEALSAYGQSLGVSFQIVDDILDYGGSNLALGKNIGDDFRERKITLPIILSISKNDVSTKSFWSRTIGHGQQFEGDFEKAQEILHNDGSLEEARKKAIKWAEGANSQLRSLPNGKVNDILSELTSFVVSRVL
ncbi:MAG: polyprenyl synthetase family protein [Pseudomonadota bacterium]|nr:polyprenyl synthetase family protein [Pseudomonadota bacterium]